MDVLKELKPEKEFFIGIDSDGCVFDSMEIKQKECFCPNFIKSFGLQSVQKYARETWEFVNLYSKFRGVNRFVAIVEAFRLLNDRPEVHARGMILPDTSPLEEWISQETRLGNPGLEEYIGKKAEPFLNTVLDWSYSVNASVAEMVQGLTPYPAVLKSLKIMREKADTLVVSQTPLEALKKEWKENGIDTRVRFIAGQEHGTKTEHIAMAAKGKYPDSKILMIGDAPGDYEAARLNGVLFYPIIPGLEEASWINFLDDALSRFFEGSYAGEYEKKLINEFHRYLPEKPSWE
ncbi:MAG: HAD family hydrolase [Bacteroides sp.]|nr:HAD family hydrolase [Bacteroides sp.]